MTTPATITAISKIKDSPELVAFSISNSQDSSSHTPNGIISHPNFEFTDIEMISLLSLTYTSLKDILPPNRSPSAIMSPTNNSSWHEIPIKNPLVKQAALAYLQPMSTPPESDDRGLFSKLMDKCCCGGGNRRLGCYAFFGEVVRIIKHAFRERGDSDDEEDYESDDDDDDDEHEDDKVD